MKPQYWMLLFVDSMRFACLLDCDTDKIKTENQKKELQLSKEAVVSLAGTIQNNYKTIGMPPPKLRAVAYNKNNQEITSKSFII